MKNGVPGEVRIRGRTKLGYAIFEISDNGRGIDPRTINAFLTCSGGREPRISPARASALPMCVHLYVALAAQCRYRPN